MKFIIFFIYVPLVHSASHTFMTTYTGINGQTIPGTPELSAVTTLDEQQIDYYDSDTGMLIPKQDWMKEFAPGDRWKKYTEIRERVQQTNKINITVLMQQFSHSDGVHTYKRRYGCVWDDETEVSDGFDEHSYDGQNFISLDLKEGRYTAHVPQAEPTVLKWNNDRKQLDFLKRYYKHECIDWLKELLNFSENKTGTVSASPGQSLTKPIQKNLTVNDIKSRKSAPYASYILIPVIFLFVLIALCTLRKCCKKHRFYYRKVRYFIEDRSDWHSSYPEPLFLSSPVEQLSQSYPKLEYFNKDQERSKDI